MPATPSAPARRRLRRRSRSGIRSGLAAVLAVTLLATGLSVGPAAQAATDQAPSFEIIRSDLEFILKQIKISESHAAGNRLLCANANDTSGTCVPHPQLPWGLRTVDGSFNNLMPAQTAYGAADQTFPRLLPILLRGGELPAPGGPPGPGGPSASTSYAQTSGFVYDSQPRDVSNYIVDLTTDNPAAVAAAGAVEGSRTGGDGSIFIPNEAPDEGLSAPFNSWMTFFGQFFDHGLDLVNKGGSGTVVIPLRPDDPLYDPASRTNFLMLTRATNKPGRDGVLGTGDDVRDHNNQTTPFVDQNQTYTSHPSHQVFLREYHLVNGRPVATGALLEGDDGGLANWREVKAQARDLLGITLSDTDVLNVPVLLTDPYGNFIPSAAGTPQISRTGGGTASGTPGAPVAVPTDARRSNHAFLDDIAHTAAPKGGPYDATLLGEHFITGDGRGNENIGLTAVHHVFHAEHNRVLGQIRSMIEALPAADPLRTGFQAPGRWNYGERLFQAARYVTEMEYQHLVFEEFGRTVQPAIDVAPANESTYHTTINAAITAEFAHVVYRFGHSMLTETVRRQGFGTADTTLLDAFLDPPAFQNPNGLSLTPDQAAGSIVNGMVQEVGGGIDEFVTETLRNSLLGLPLDLATINMARARDTGVPGLQAARATFFQATGDHELAPYTSWADFGSALKHRSSLANFIAAYGNHPTLTSGQTVAQRRAAATALLADPAFMDAPAAGSGLNNVDFWVGGLAERPVPFGGMLGPTFNFVFEAQLEALQNGDRFYYLNRNIGLNLFHQLEANSFSALVMRTTDATRLPAGLFDTPAMIFDLASATAGGGFRREPDGTWRYDGDEHINMQGTPSNDRMRGGIGDDSLWGYDGDDVLTGGAGANAVVGGAGRDIILGMAGEDNLKGNAGNDAINAGSGIDLIHGGPGHDFVAHNSDETQTFAGLGNDFVVGGNAHDIIAGNEGDDWLEGGIGSDLVQGDNANGFQNDPNGGHDIIMGGAGNDDHDAEGGDDIMVSSPGTDRHEGMLGFDWVTHKGDPNPANADMDNTVFQTPDESNFRDRYDLVEGLSGWELNDILRGVGRQDAPGAGHELSDAQIRRIAGLDALLGCPAGWTTATNCAYAMPFTEENVAQDLILGGRGNDLIEGRGGDDFIDGDAWLDVQLAHGGQRHDTLQPLVSGVFAGTIDPGNISIIREIVAEADGGSDVAVFSDVRASYDVTAGADGVITVDHARGTQTDGVDRLRNVERLQFSDQTVNSIPDNTVATGTVAISSQSPNEGRALTASANLVDPDGVNQGSVLFTWQMLEGVDWVPVGTPATGTNGQTLTPDDPEVGRALRAVVTFTDNLGVIETVTSAPTRAVRNVNDAPTGQPTLNTSVALQGVALTADTATVADPDGIVASTFRLQWQQTNRNGRGGFGNIRGATSPSFTPGPAQVGRRLRAVVTFGDHGGTNQSVPSEPTARIVGLPAISVRTPLTFRNIRVGVARTANLRVTNTGTGPLRLSGVTVSGESPFRVELGNCGGEIAARRSCNLRVSYGPTAAQTITANLQVTSNAATSPTNVTLRGTSRR